jgi:hypothetical protein
MPHLGRLRQLGTEGSLRKNSDSKDKTQQKFHGGKNDKEQNSGGTDLFHFNSQSDIGTKALANP